MGLFGFSKLESNALCKLVVHGAHREQLLHEGRGQGVGIDVAHQGASIGCRGGHIF